MDALTDRRRRLYGTERTMKADVMKDTLKKSVVFNDGEYNFTKDGLKNGIWNTSFQTDFTGRAPENVAQGKPPTQLNHHFELTAPDGPDHTNYQSSLSHDDYVKKGGVKTVPCPIDRTINWPDMAPQYMENPTLGDTEYSNQFMSTEHALSAPVHPKINTSKVQLPLDPEKYQRLGDASIVLGSDVNKLASEHQSCFSEDRLKGRTNTQASISNTSSLKNTSHVFRAGDYNSPGVSFETNNMTDYGPRTKSPCQQVTAKLLQQENPSIKLDPSLVDENYLNRHAQQVTVPGVYKEAREGRNDQENAHFKFGTDESTVESLYSKDFLLAAQKPRSRPNFYKTPSSGKIIQNDPIFSKFGESQNSSDFYRKPVEQRIQANGKTEADNNMSRRHGRNFTLTSKDKINPNDMLVSLSHGDFMAPPSTFKPMTPKRAPPVRFDFLKANDALPYSAPISGSEAKNTFTGTLMNGYEALQRRYAKEYNCRSGVELNRDTHFTIGVENLTPDHTTENRSMFTGVPIADRVQRTAGIRETIPERQFSHLSVSENTSDYTAADPYVASTKEALRARNLCMSERNSGKKQTPFETSVMRNDFVPLDSSRFTESHQKRIEQVNKIFNQPLEKSHLFHTDTSGGNNMVSTSMNDFVKPEHMTGQKLLGVR